MKRNLFWIAYLCCLAVAAFYCFKRPLYNWDLLPYSVLILQTDHHNPADAFSIAYRSAKENIPFRDYRSLTDSSNAYRYKLANDYASFSEQLPFYAVKPLYVSFAYLCYKLGFSLIEATILPSVVSYLLLGVLLFYWLSLYLRLSVSFIVSFLAMICSPLIEVAKLSTPDSLSAFLLVSSFYFILERPSLPFSILFMLLSIFARLDNVIACVLMTSLIYFSRKWKGHVTRTTFFVIIGLFIACYVLITLKAKEYGWSVFFYNDFATHLHPLYGSKAHFSITDYARLMYEHLLSAINHSYFVIFMALLCLNFNGGLSLKKLPFEKLFAALIPVILLSRFMLYPDISDRFYVAWYVVILILLVKNFYPRLTYLPANAE